MAPRRGSRPVAMRHEATVTATVDGSTNSVSVSVTALASDGGVGKNSRSCAVLARDAARQSRVPPGGYSMLEVSTLPSRAETPFARGLGRYAVPEVTRALTERTTILEEEDGVDVGSSSGGGCG
ncbi:hypothetical protein H109_06292 [Trichophyton interdigitale MR816]|uniref:Uncharacterized protein n=1 Tax=Trichophyton interdigitale (strain MR816) TaxID=1215338 RepID=A0A059J1P7_TRIIM|nr:hypothetical protein H109_06292 [Trichophyton interdigitale MR816]